MEVVINNIEHKGDTSQNHMVVLTFGIGAEATLNTKWQDKEVKYLEGFIGGTADIVIKQNGQYTNVDSVNMESGKKANLGAVTEKVIEKDIPKDKPLLLSGRDASIVAQVMVKEANNLLCATMPRLRGEMTSDIAKEFYKQSITELVGAYRLALKELTE